MAIEKTERQLLEEINERLKQIVGLLAISGKSQDEQISILTELGFDSTTVGNYVGLSGTAVRNRRMRGSKKSKVK